MYKLYNQIGKNCFSIILIKNYYKVKNEQIMPFRNARYKQNHYFTNYKSGKTIVRAR